MSIGFASFIVVAGSAVVHETLTMGDFTALLTILKSFSSRVRDIVKLTVSIQRGLVNLKRVMGVLNLPDRNEEDKAMAEMYFNQHVLQRYHEAGLLDKEYKGGDATPSGDAATTDSGTGTWTDTDVDAVKGSDIEIPVLPIQILPPQVPQKDTHHKDRRGLERRSTSQMNINRVNTMSNFVSEPIAITAEDSMNRQDVDFGCVKPLRDEICKHLLSDNKKLAARMQEFMCDEKCISIKKLFFAYPTREMPRSHDEITMGPDIFSDFSYDFTVGTTYNFQGFGSSTLLRLIAEVLSPTSGLISVPLNFKRVMSHRIPDILEGTLMSNVMAGASPKYSEVHAKALMRMIGIHDSLIDNRIFLVSGGRNLKWADQKLVALARAIICDPEVLCVNRPSEGQTKAVKARIERVIQDWCSGVLEGFEGNSSRRTVFAVGFHATDIVDVELPAYSQFHEEGEQE